MTTTRPVPEDQPLDLTTVTADDQLLDTLGRGAPGSTDDRVARLLAGWRTDLASDGPGGYADADLVRAVTNADAPATEPADGAGAPALPSMAEAVRRVRPLVLAAAAAVVAVATLGLGANAGPSSPLWPIVEVVAPHRADVRAAEHAIALARAAVKTGRFDDAQQLLTSATTHVADVRDPEVARRLRDDIDQLREALPATGRGAPNQSEPRSATTPAEPAPTPTRGPAADPSPAGSSAQQGPAPPPLINVPTLPIPPLPSPPPAGETPGVCLLRCLIP
jgi:hypothetical protein